MPEETKLLANVFSQIVSHDIVVDGVTLAHAGDRVILVPMTTYRAVMVGNQSLEDLWDTLSKDGHAHSASEITSGTLSADRLPAGIQTALNNAGVARNELSLTTPIAQNAIVTVPDYKVGAKQLELYIDGTRCTLGDTYDEVGESGATSTRITIKDAISDDYEVVAVVR